MEGPARTRLVALVALLAVAVPLTIVAVVGSGGGDDDEARVRVNPARIDDVASCRVRPADPPLQGPVS